MEEDRTYWPFQTIPFEQMTDQHHAELDFFSTAHGEGYRAFTFCFGFGAESSGDRVGHIVRRGGHNQNWEVVLSEAEKEVGTAYVAGFKHASDAVLLWLGGRPAKESVIDMESWLGPSGIK